MTLPWSPELEAVEAKKRVEVEEAIIAAKGNVCHAALVLGVKRPTLHRWLEEYELVDAAAELREEAGQGRMGRPKKR
jgi:DNA-binding NtrC family response regulator